MSDSYSVFCFVLIVVTLLMLSWGVRFAQKENNVQ